jgi:hypothetical protein
MTDVINKMMDFIFQVSMGGLKNIVEDLTPELGANLDVNGKTITDTTNGVPISAGNQAVGITAGGTLHNFDTDGNLDMNQTKIIDLLDPTADQEAATKKYVDDNAGQLDFTVSDVSGSRAFDTNYQNTSGKAMVVSVSASWQGGGDAGQLQALIGASSPPTSVANQCCGDQASGANYSGMTFIVPDDYYYQVKDLGGTTPTEDEWLEYALA